MLSNAVLDCDIPLSSLDVRELDGGEALELTGVSRTFASDVQTEDLYCVLAELGAPSALQSKIGSTRALDGRQTDEWDGFAISWSYHPDDGANVLIEHR